MFHTIILLLVGALGKLYTISSRVFLEKEAPFYPSILYTDQRPVPFTLLVLIPL